MVLCFFSSSLFLGPNRAVRSAAAFCPSLVLTIAFWNAMIPTLVGGVAEAEVCGGAPVWAWDSSAAPRAMAGKKTQFFVKLKLLDFVSILTYCNRPHRGCASERPANGEAEQIVLLEERVGVAERRNGVEKGRLVREDRAVRHDRRLQILPHQQGVVRPIDAEWRLHHGQQDLQFQTGGHARALRARVHEGFTFKTGGGVCVVQILDSVRIHVQLARTQDSIDAGVLENRQHHRPEDRDAVLEIADHARVSTGEGELVDRNVHGHVSGGQSPIGVDQGSALRTVVVQYVDGGLAGNEGYGTDAPNLKTANILFAANIGAGKGRNLLAAVTGDHGGEHMKSQDIRLMPGRGFEVLALYHRLDGIDVAPQEAAGEGSGDKQALATRRRDGMIHGIVRKRGYDAAGTDTLQGVGAGDPAEIDVIEVRRRGGGLRLHVGNIVAVSDAQAGDAALQQITGRHREAMSGLDVIQQVLRAERVEQRDEIFAGENGSLAALIIIEAGQVGFHTDLQRKIEEVRLRETG